MSTIPLVKRHFYADVASTIEDLNIDAERLLLREGLTDWRNGDPESAVPLAHLIKAYGLGARAAGEDRFGIILAERDPPETLHSFGLALRRTKTVRDALNITCRLAPRLATSLRCWLQSSPEGIWFCRRQLAGAPELRAGLTQLEMRTVTFLAQIVRLGAGPNWRPTRVWLSSESENSGISNWEALYDTSLRFGAPFSAIFVPNEVLGLRIRNRDTGVCDGSSADKNELRDAWTPQDFVGSLAYTLSLVVDEGVTTLKAMAEIACMSERTLQRRLEREGTSFTKILDEVRFKNSIEMLQEPDIQIQDIGDCLGYKQTHHFIRAFKRWSGVTPGQYRIANQFA